MSLLCATGVLRMQMWAIADRGGGGGGGEGGSWEVGRGRQGVMQGWVTDVCSLLYLWESDASLWPPRKKGIYNANASVQLPSGWTNLCSTLDIYLLPSDWRSPLTERRQERRYTFVYAHVWRTALRSFVCVCHVCVSFGHVSLWLLTVLS